MCRMTLYCGPQRPLHPLVFGGAHSLLRQSWEPRELLSGSVNVDGYGVAWHDGQNFVRVAQPVPIWHDEDLETLLSSVQASLGLAAVRNATPGIPVDRSGLLPLMQAGHAFVLNGFVENFRSRWMRRFRATLPDHLYGALRGSSDSETLFLMALARIEGGATPGEALADLTDFVCAAVRGEGLTAQLTMALADSEGVAVVRTGSEAETNSLYFNDGSSLMGGGRLVASEPLEREAGWEGVPPHHLLQMEVDGSFEVTPL